MTRTSAATLDATYSIGECGSRGTLPADCKLGHPCCAIHAVENPGEPCIACKASRALHGQDNHWARRERENRAQREAEAE